MTSGSEADDLRALLATAAHDLNNHLGVISNYGTLLSRQLTDPLQRSDVAAMTTAASDARNLMRRTMTAAGADPCHPSRTDVNDVVRATVDRLTEERDQSTVTLDLAAGPVLGLADPDQLAQLLGELIDMALAVAGPQVVTVRTSELGNPTSDRPRAVVQVIGTDGQGPGLGAAVVRTLVRQNQAQLSWQPAADSPATVTLELAESSDQESDHV